MGLGVLFPGQGTQHSDMLPWLESRARDAPALRMMQARLGLHWRDQLRDPDWTRRNDMAQCLLTGTGLSAWAVMQHMLPEPVAMAGLSVGEVAAFCAAGACTVEQAMVLVERRAALMDVAAQGRDTGLLSVSDGPVGLSDRLCVRHGLSVAIRMGRTRCVLGGLCSSLQAAEADAHHAGARCQILAVALASHTPWMEAAQAPMAQLLQDLALTPPHTTLVSNWTGDAVHRPDELRQALSSQLAATVQWDLCMDTLAERGVRCVLEVGPGKTLANAWNARHGHIPARSLDDFRQPESAAAWVAGALGWR